MCLICKKDAEMRELDISNDIRINKYYDCSDALLWCSYCGAVFIDRYDLGIKDEEHIS